MDDPAPTCTSVKCWPRSAKISMIIITLCAALAFLVLMWHCIFRLLRRRSKRRERDLESGCANRRGRIATLFYGVFPPAKKHRRRRQKNSNRNPPLEPIPEDNGLLGNAAWEVVGRVTNWMLRNQEGMSQVAHRGHERNPSTLPPPRPVHANRGRRPVQEHEETPSSYSMTTLSSHKPSRIDPSMGVTDTDSAPGSTSTCCYSTSATCNTWIRPPTPNFRDAAIHPSRRSASQPVRTRNSAQPGVSAHDFPHLHLAHARNAAPPPRVSAHDFAHLHPGSPAHPRPLRARTATANLRERVVVTYTLTGPTSPVPHNATVRAYGRQAASVAEPPRVYQRAAGRTPRYSY